VARKDNSTTKKGKGKKREREINENWKLKKTRRGGYLGEEKKLESW